MNPERRHRVLLLAYPRPYRTERGQEMLDVRLVAATGLVGVALASLAGTAAYVVLGNGALSLVEDVRGPALPRVLAAAVLASGLLRARHGRAALLMLGMLAAGPLDAHWSEPMGVLGAGTAVLFVAGYALASRSRRVDPSTPGPRLTPNQPCAKHPEKHCLPIGRIRAHSPRTGSGMFAKQVGAEMQPPRR